MRRGGTRASASSSHDNRHGGLAAFTLQVDSCPQCIWQCKYHSAEDLPKSQPVQLTGTPSSLAHIK